MHVHLMYLWNFKLDAEIDRVKYYHYQASHSTELTKYSILLMHIIAWPICDMRASYINCSCC